MYIESSGLRSCSAGILKNTTATQFSLLRVGFYMNFRKDIQYFHTSSNSPLNGRIQISIFFDKAEVIVTVGLDIRNVVKNKPGDRTSIHSRNRPITNRSTISSHGALIVIRYTDKMNRRRSAKHLRSNPPSSSDSSYL